MKRRDFLVAAGAAACGGLVAAAAPAEKIIDIHQHTHYWGRNDDDLVRHQRALGIAKTVLLPAGSRYGLEADCYGNDSVVAVAKRYPREFVFFANEDPTLPDATAVIERYLKAGAIGIGEQKFFVDSDSEHVVKLAELARAYRVPILLHFQHEKYNKSFERFHKVLERFPQVHFIGHAQTMWGNIDRNLNPKDLYPKGPVAPGGLTDRWLADYPNFHADLSAGSGANAFARDEEHARGFLLRHQDKLMFGSDCQDVDGKDERCVGTKQLAMVRRLVADSRVREKILYRNASRLLRIRI
ncbi:MAG: amidohydrolase family protein [Blastocatellia bacterium]|nr:amidohydrolase family protein [Blastocatellia bacterium]